MSTLSVLSQLPTSPVSLGARVLRSVFKGKATTEFASLLQSQLAPTTTQPSTTTADVTAQLTALLQKGTPLPTIVNRLATLVVSAVRSRIGGTAHPTGGDRSSIDAVARALSPPANAPPGTAAQEAAALAQRLDRILNAVARETEQTAGQQSDFSGLVLDANAAKELPARQTPLPTTTPLQGSSSAQLSFAVTPPSQPLQSVPLPAGTPVPSPSASTTPAPPAPLATTSDDLLTRIIARASGVDQRVNGAVTAQVAGDSGSTVSTPSTSVLAARFAAALAELAGQQESAPQQNGFSQPDFGRQSADSGTAPSTTTTSATPAIGGAAGGPVIAFAAQLPTPATTPHAAPIDANAVVEQLVKSIAVRTAQPGTSEIRLQLSPANLGEITLKLTVSGSSVSANVVAQSADVGKILSTNHQQLARSLADAGLTLSGFSVDVSGGDAGKDHQRDRASGFGRHYTVHELPGAVDAASSTESANQGPALVPASTLALFNYLA